MRVAITNDSKDAHRGCVRDDAGWWLRHQARDRWRVREDEDEDIDGREVLTFEPSDPLDAINFNMQPGSAERRGRLD